MLHGCKADSMRVKRLAACRVRIYLQPVTCNSTRKFKSSPFLQIFGHISAYPGTIAINFTWMERGVDTCKTPRCLYTSIFNHFWDIAIYRWLVLVENCDIFVPCTPLFSAPVGGDPVGVLANMEVHTKLEWMGYHVVKKIR